jgi:CheY-like chemotaxis protein
MRAKKVLVVDDSEIQCLLCKKVLDEFEVDCANTAPAALHIVDLFQPDVIVLDLMMPFMNGFEFLERIKSAPLHKHIPVIICSALKDYDTKEHAFELKASAYIEKPVYPDILKSTISEVLTNSIMEN